ncbi:MAG: glycosyl transferase [Phycisphaeraceae bacterium]|nr:MAG: glycosyl transferase [Phycisphaeraceae bacterium]
MTNVAVIIVNYRTAGLVVDCLASIAEHAVGTPPRTFVVENGSPDGSRATLALAIDVNGWSPWVTLVPADRNGGFAYGNNVGIRAALSADPGTRYLHLLNPDTIVRAGSIDELARFLDANPSVGLAGSRLEDPDTTPQRSAFRFPTVAGELDAAVRLGPVSRALSPWAIAPPVRHEPHRADWVAGASLMLRREVLEHVGLLDDGYFMYYEEVEFCRRAARAGWPCWYVPASRVVHLIGKASGVVQGQPTRRPGYWFDSRRRYFITQHGRARAALADAAWVVGTPVHRLWSLARSRPNADPPRFVRDLVARGALTRGLTR